MHKPVDYNTNNDFTHINVNGTMVEYDYRGNSCTDYLNMDIPVLSLKIPSSFKESKPYYERIKMEVDKLKAGDSIEVPFMRGEHLFNEDEVEFILPGYEDDMKRLFPDKKLIAAPDYFLKE